MKKDTNSLVKAALLTGLSVILTRFFAIMVPIAGLPTIRIGFGDIPITMAGIILGPVYGALTGFASDVLGVLVNSQGAFHPGFTLTSTLTGLIPGLIFMQYKKKDNWLTFKKVFSVTLTNGIINSMILNTIWLSGMFGKSFLVMLPPRLLSSTINLILHAVIIYAILDKARGYIGENA